MDRSLADDIQATTRSEIVRGYDRVERHRLRVERHRVAVTEFIEKTEQLDGRIRCKRIVAGRVVEIWFEEPHGKRETRVWRPSGKRLA